jgi:YVTN family beta-propeller protein
LKHRSFRIMRWAALLLCALLFAGCGASTASHHSPPTFAPVNYSSLPSAGTVVATIPSVAAPIPAGYVYAIAADNSAVWVHDSAKGTVVRVDTTANKVVATIPVGHGLGGMVLGGGFVWVVNHDDSTISKIDPQTNKVVDTIPLPPPVGFLGVSPGAVWVASKANDAVMKIDTTTDKVIATIVVPGGPAWLSFAAGSLWVCIHDGTAYGVARLDPTSNKLVATIGIGGAQGDTCEGIAASDQSIWAELLDPSQTYDLGLVRIDPKTNKVIATVLLPQSFATSAVAADAQGVWSAKPEKGVVYVSSKTNRETGFLSAQGASGVALGSGSLWVISSNGSLMRITPTT